MKPFFSLPLLLLALASCGGADRPSSSPMGAGVAAVDSSAVPRDTLRDLVMRVRSQSRLYTAEFQVHKVVLFSDESRLGGALLNLKFPGDRKVAVPIDLTLKGFVDFSRFSALNVHCGDSLLIITLPDPGVTVTASKIDHKGTRQYLSVGRSAFTDAEITRLAQQGEDSILSHLSHFDLIEASRRSAARTLVPLLCAMGYKESNIIVRFRKDFGDLRDLLQPLPQL